MPAFTYILRCKDGALYYGFTADLRRRLQEHRDGKVHSTAWRRPVQFVWYEIHETAVQARRRERSFKNGRTRRKTIEQLIRTFPDERLAPFA
jgi:putative endonuclease